MSATAVLLVAFLVAYTIVGLVYGFNLWHASERAARHFERYPRPLRWIGRDDPASWRGGGLVMLAFGAVTLLWLLLQTGWQLPVIDRTIAAAALIGIGVISAIWLIVRRTRRA